MCAGIVGAGSAGLRWTAVLPGYVDMHLLCNSAPAATVCLNTITHFAQLARLALTDPLCLLQVHYMLDKPKDAKTWKGGVGYIGADVIKQHMPAPSKHLLVWF